MRDRTEGWGRGLLENGVITEVGIEQGEPDGLEVVAYAPNAMGSRGNFALTVRLTKREIANLARIALAKDRFSDVIDLLTARD